MIEIELPDGTVIEFPEGTPQDVMTRAVQQATDWQDSQQPSTGAPDDMIRVPMADGSIAEFPSHIPQDVLQHFIDRQQAGQPNPTGAMDVAPPDLRGTRERAAQDHRPGMLESAVHGAAQGVTFGAADEIAGGVGGLVGAVMPGQTMREGYEEYRDRARGMLEASRRENPWTTGLSEVGSAMALPMGPAAGFVSQGAGLGARSARSAAVGGGLGAVYGFGAGEGGVDERGHSAWDTALIGAGLGAASPAMAEIASRLLGRSQRAAAREMARTTESVDDLRERGGDLFRQARATGETLGPNQTGDLAARLRGIAEEFGAVTPSGRVDPGMPGIAHALAMADDFATGSMRPEQYQAFRGAIQRAAGSSERAERALGVRMLEAFDEFADDLSPLFREGNATLARAHRGDLIERTIQLAGDRAGQFSGSGFENALRTEFRALARDITRGRLRGLTPDQTEAIQRVARGGPVENLLRGMGRAAPSSLPNIAMGGGMPFLIGNAVGGPMAGAAASAATMGIGGLSRRAATTMQTNNAQIAAALMRSATGRAPEARASLAPIVQRLLGPAAAPIASQIQQRRTGVPGR